MNDVNRRQFPQISLKLCDIFIALVHTIKVFRMISLISAGALVSLSLTWANPFNPRTRTSPFPHMGCLLKGLRRLFPEIFHIHHILLFGYLIQQFLILVFPGDRITELTIPVRQLQQVFEGLVQKGYIAPIN